MAEQERDAEKAREAAAKEAAKGNPDDDALIALARLKEAVFRLQQNTREKDGTVTIANAEFVMSGFVGACESFERAGQKQRAARVREAAKIALDEGYTDRVKKFLAEEPAEAGKKGS